MTENTPTGGKFLYIDPGFVPMAQQSTEPEYTHTEKEALALLLEALPEVDMDPLIQLSGYLTSDDPSFLPDHKGVRPVMTKIGRDKLLRYLLNAYFEQEAAHTEGGTV